MKVSKREKTLLFIVLLLALVGAYYLLFLKPYLAEIGELNGQLANSKAQVSTYAQIKVNVDNVDEEIAKKQAEIEEFSGYISTGFDQPPVLVYLEDTVGKHGQKNMFVFGIPEKVGQLIISPVTITMVTTYDGLKGFITDVTGGEYIISVTSIEAMVTSAIEEDVAAPPGDQTDLTTGDVVETPGDQTDLTAGDVIVPVTPVPSGEKSEGAIMVENSDTLINVSIQLEIYSMSGVVPEDKEYIFGNGSYNYGGDIFY